MISLYSRVPKTRNKNPKNWKSEKLSYGTCSMCTNMKKIQMSTVREVSIVDRCALEAFLVTVTPKALKEAIEKQIATESPIKSLFAS